MAQNYQTPGVYIAEQNAFPNSVVPVATAIPAFIGYTQQTSSTASQGQDLTGIATQITSLKQFEDYFGTGYSTTFTANATTAVAQPASLPPSPVVNFSDGSSWTLSPTTNPGTFFLYSAMQMFYLNGGGTCYIISLGSYQDVIGDATADPVVPPAPPTPTAFTNALSALELEPDPTMVLCPDALLLTSAQYYQVMTAVLTHCNLMKSRVSVMDVYGGAYFTPPGTDPTIATGPVTAFRTGIGQNYLNYGIAYFPWVNSSLLSASTLGFYDFLSLDGTTLVALGKDLNPAPPQGSTAVQVVVPTWASTDPTSTTEIFTEAKNLLDYYNGGMDATSFPTIQGMTPAQVWAQLQTTITAVNNSLMATFPNYTLLLNAITTYLNVVPVAPAIAGVITATDTNIGVWQAPANLSLNAVVSPTVGLNDLLQQNMNVDAATGKSVNAIRAFRGMGTLVWGARTLAGNSQDWRYINVRRTMIMLEQSIKLAARAYVFQPNTASTWTTVKSMISAFLFNIWKQGGLAGASPGDAFQVQIGLGVTMTADDVLNGLMNITVLVAVVHPAEFIAITFQQQMQKS